MTLFKKVFQSQARPAKEDETPDVDVLREAMAARAGETSPLVLGLEESVQPQELEQPHAADMDHQGEPEGSHRQADLNSDGVACDLEEPVEELTVTAKDFPDAEDVEDTEQTEAGDFDEPDLVAIMAQATVDSEPDAPSPNSMDVAEQKADQLSVEAIAGPETERGADANDETEQHPGEQVSAEEEVSPALDADEPASDIADFARRQLQEIEPASVSDVASEGAEADEPEATRLDLSDMSRLSNAAGRTSGRANRPVGRVKTRLLGFNRDQSAASDTLDPMSGTTATPHQERFPVGWLVVIDGPGIGHAFSIFTGASTIGRGDDQIVSLNFGDNSISRQNHAAIAYDEEVNKFYIGHGGKSNIIRRNARPVLSTEELHHADLLRIGETTLRFVALCGSDFQWNASEDSHAVGV